MKSYWEKKKLKRRDDQVVQFARTRLTEMKKQRLYEAIENFAIWQ